MNSEWFVQLVLRLPWQLMTASPSLGVENECLVNYTMCYAQLWQSGPIVITPPRKRPRVRGPDSCMPVHTCTHTHVHPCTRRALLF
jgi:hypothetical protein